MAEAAALLAQFHFLRPWWLAGIVVVLIVAWFLHRGERQKGLWDQVISPALLPFLVDKGGAHTKNIKPWVVAAGIVACIALAGPTWSKREVQLHRQNQPLIVLFDLSPSMLATDLTPDRLTRARLKTIDLLSGYREGSSALIAYAGEAHTVTPITDDTNTIISQLPVLHPDIMPVSGSNPEAALSLAFDLTENAGYTDGDILLVTDGLTLDATKNIHAMLADHSGFRLSILGVGTEDGAPIPLNEHGFARDSRGSIVIAQLRGGELAGLARRSGGVYQTITGSDQDLNRLLAPLVSRNSADAKALERNLDVWEDRGIWLVYLLLPLALAIFRKGFILGLLLLPLVHSPNLQAGLWEDLWQTRDRQGMEKLEAGDPGKAAELFEDPAWQGVANHRKGDYDKAAEAFSSKNTADAHYNRGNALARAGRLEKALEAYDQALQQQPGMEDAQYNRALVENLLKQKQQQQEQNQEGEGTNGNTGESGEGSPSGSRRQQDEQSREDQSSESGETGNAGENSAQEQTGEPQSRNSDPSGEKAGPEDSRRAADEPPGEAPPSPAEQIGEKAANNSPEGGPAKGVAESNQMSDEERMNAEQWLRRVPDDPGGLLRRKFEFESRQRFRDERSNIRTAPGNYSEERW